MQLYCRAGRVVATHADDQTVPASVYGEGVVVLPYEGEASPDLIGGPVPEVDLVRYAAAARYRVETAGVTAQIGGQPVPMSTRREDRDGARDALIAVIAGLRQDGAVFKFADGVPRPAANAEMSAAIAAAFGHVQAAYDREAAVLALIAAGTLRTVAEIDAAFA